LALRPRNVELPNTTRRAACVHKGAPAKIILVHGTWGRGFDPDKEARRKDGSPAEPRWFEAGSKFRFAPSSGLSGLVQATDFSAFLWSGANSIEERRSAAARLAKTLDENVAAAAPEARHFIIAHSHGGNVALDARQAMSGDALNVHIITMATPFLSIYHRTSRITDKVFATCLSIGLVVFTGYLLISCAFGVSSEYAAFVLFSAVCLILLLSIVFGATTFFSRAYQTIRKKQPICGSRSRALSSAKRINNQSLLASGLLFCSSWFAFGLYVAIPIFPVFLPALLLFFLSTSTVGDFLYGYRYETPSVRRIIPNLTILRSQRDEASLALFFGKIASLLVHVTGSISIIVPIAAASTFRFGNFTCTKNAFRPARIASSKANRSFYCLLRRP